MAQSSSQKNLTPTPAAKPPVDAKKSLKYQRDKDREMVKGIFRFYEVPGGSMSFNIKIYKEDPVERYDFVDGQVYTIPMGVAKHLNKNGWYPQYEFIQGEKGTQSAFGMNGERMRIGKKVRRFGFQSLDFMDTNDLNDNQLVTVESF